MREALERYGVVPLKADKTRPSEEIDELLVRLGNRNKAIPFYALFPANDPLRPLVLDGLLTGPRKVVRLLEEGTRSQMPRRQAEKAGWRVRSRPEL